MAVEFDFLIDPVTHDMVIRDGDFVIVKGVQAIVQRVKIRLLFFLEEYILDPEEGTPWFEQILIKNPDMVAVSSILKERILGTPGIVSLQSFGIEKAESVGGARKRNLQVSFRAQSEEGTIDFKEII